MSMLSALIRVAARAAEIQLEEVAASAALRTAAKGKGRATLQEVDQLEVDRAAAWSPPTPRQHVGLASTQSDVSTFLKDSIPPANSNLRSTVGLSTESIIQPTVQGEPNPQLKPAAAAPKPISHSAPAANDVRVESSPSVSPDLVFSTPGAGPSIHPVRQPSPSVTLEPDRLLRDLNRPPLQDEIADLVKPQEPSASRRPVSTLDQQNVSSEPLIDTEDDEIPVVLRASKVPSSRIGRLLHYGSLAASMSFGAATESIRRTTGGDPGKGSVFMSDANIRRLVSSLGQMRGAALKLGQFMSIQDNHLLPPEIEQVLQQVQAHANYMPDWQMEQVLSSELGSDWQSLFSSFDRTPIASASIGQVHRATLASTGQDVAVKIQFPGIASSIHSDLNNLSILLRTSSLLPKGMYLQNTIAVMRRELEEECDYVREGAAGKRFTELLKDDSFFSVPRVVDEATTGKVLTTEWAVGKPLSRMKGMSQATRDKIGENILRLCLQELFQFRFMQTDPNWANFLYDAASGKITLIDFGASREYTKEFMDGWYRLLTAALRGDRVAMKVESQSLGYLTGEENEDMLKAHLDSMALIASPFSTSGPYPFANQTITDSVRALIPVMLRHRLTPPPPETYSLNRKLSGAFLMCAKLGANVDCVKLWEDNVGNYQQG